MTCDEPPDASKSPTVTDGLTRLRRFTPARIALGRSGTGQPTAASLRFALEHARARDAVHAKVDFTSLAKALQLQGWHPVAVRSAAEDRAVYLRRPDLGRRLSREGRSLIEGQDRGCDVAIVAADGLSGFAIDANLVPLLDHLRPLLLARGLTIGPISLVEQGRVAVGDEIGELLEAKLTIVLLGERPGLSAADSLGAYITWHPQIGTMDSERNCVSNIRPGGLPPLAAAVLISELVGSAFAHSTTVVRLSDIRSAGSETAAIT